MIIAIDESGDFAIYSGRFNYFVAVLLSEKGNALAEKEAQFQDWKKTISPAKFDKFNEVKGTELTEEELFRFTRDVLLSAASVYPVTIRVTPNENVESLQDKFQAIELEVIDKSIAFFEKKELFEQLEFYKKLRRWYEKRNFQHYMKLGMLQQAIGSSLVQAIGMSIAEWAITGSDENLMSISIMIDEDFVTSAGDRSYFDEILRQAIRQITQKHPIPIAREMIENGHPFVKEYQVKGDKINLFKLLKDRLSFRSSRENWPLQIADIYSTIVQRVENKKTCLDSWELINKHFKNHIRIHYKMNPNPETETRIEFDSDLFEN